MELYQQLLAGSETVDTFPVSKLTGIGNRLRPQYAKLSLNALSEITESSMTRRVKVSLCATCPGGICTIKSTFLSAIIRRVNRYRMPDFVT